MAQHRRRLVPDIVYRQVVPPVHERQLAPGFDLRLRAARGASVPDVLIRHLMRFALLLLGFNHQLDRVQRMDASIMEGSGLRAGAVASIEESCIRSRPRDW